jgi:predicted membrane-bound dolichyl-phosphate-mannose-protein mannosyltransferase
MVSLARSDVHADVGAETTSGGAATPATPAPPSFLGALFTNAPLLALLSIAASLRAFRLGQPGGALIGDEVYYVQAARVMLGLPVVFHHLPGTAASGLDPNAEHPPLAKLIMAGFIAVFGDRDFAFRIPSVVLGTLSIALFHQIVLQLGGTRRQALFAAFAMTFDNLSFVHGRIATLDVYIVAFSLLGTWLYFGSCFELAGVAFGVASLCKINGFLGLFALFLYEGIRTLGSPWRAYWRRARPLLLTTAFCLAFFFAGLGALDCEWTNFRNPWAHVVSIIEFAKSMTRNGPPQGTESSPLQWWLNLGVMNYFTVTSSSNGLTWTTILFKASMNDYLIFAAPFAFLFAIRRAWAQQSSGAKIGAFVVASVAANYGPVVYAWARYSRMSYIYYMLPSMPALIAAIALLGNGGGRPLPRAIRWGYVAAILYSFCFSFPFHYFY